MRTFLTRSSVCDAFRKCVTMLYLCRALRLLCAGIMLNHCFVTPRCDCVWTAICYAMHAVLAMLRYAALCRAASRFAVVMLGTVHGAGGHGEGGRAASKCPHGPQHEGWNDALTGSIPPCCSSCSCATSVSLFHALPKLLCIKTATRAFCQQCSTVLAGVYFFSWVSPFV